MTTLNLTALREAVEDIISDLRCRAKGCPCRRIPEIQARRLAAIAKAKESR